MLYVSTEYRRYIVKLSPTYEGDNLFYLISCCCEMFSFVCPRVARVARGAWRVWRVARVACVARARRRQGREGRSISMATLNYSTTRCIWSLSIFIVDKICLSCFKFCLKCRRLLVVSDARCPRSIFILTHFINISKC